MFSLRTRSFPLKSTKRASSFKLLIFQIVLHYWSFWPVRFYLTRLDLYNKNVGTTVGATSSSGQNTKSAGFRNRLLPRRTRLQSFQLCVTLTASGETITSEQHFTHKLFNKRKKSSHTRLKTTTKKENHILTPWISPDVIHKPFCCLKDWIEPEWCTMAAFSWFPAQIKFRI